MKEFRIVWQTPGTTHQQTNLLQSEESAVKRLVVLQKKGKHVLKVQSRMVQPWRKVRKLRSKDITATFLEARFPINDGRRIHG